MAAHLNSGQTQPAETRKATRSSVPKQLPGPRSFPPGLTARVMLRDPLRNLLADIGRYGDLIGYRMIGTRIVLAAHPDAIRQVLIDKQEIYSKQSSDYVRLRKLLGDGLLTSEGPYWSSERHALQPHFSHQRLAAYASAMVAATNAMIERWTSAAARGEPLDIFQEMARLTLIIVGRTLLDTDLSADAERINHALTIANAHFGTVSLFGLLAPWLPTRRNRRMRAALRELDAITYRIVAERRRHPGPEGDLITALFAARDPATGALLSDRQLRDEVITLMLAGHETTANALAWTFYLLWQNRDARDKLVREAREVLGGREPTAEDLARLRYTRMVLDESLRLYPPAWATSRRAEVDDTIGGYRIRRGSLLLISQWVTHRHPALWDEPERFIPERFAPERAADSRPRLAYFPFGAGPRTCIGAAFALTEATLVLAAVSQRFLLDLVPDHPVVPQPLITLRPRYGLRMTLTPIG